MYRRQLNNSVFSYLLISVLLMKLQSRCVSDFDIYKGVKVFDHQCILKIVEFIVGG
jgi:hypothetical protein